MNYFGTVLHSNFQFPNPTVNQFDLNRLWAKTALSSVLHNSTVSMVNHIPHSYRREIAVITLSGVTENMYISI